MVGVVSLIVDIQYAPDHEEILSRVLIRVMGGCRIATTIRDTCLIGQLVFGSSMTCNNQLIVQLVPCCCAFPWAWRGHNRREARRQPFSVRHLQRIPVL